MAIRGPFFGSIVTRATASSRSEETVWERARSIESCPTPSLPLRTGALWSAARPRRARAIVSSQDDPGPDAHARHHHRRPEGVHQNIAHPEPSIKRHKRMINLSSLQYRPASQQRTRPAANAGGTGRTPPPAGARPNQRRRPDHNPESPCATFFGAPLSRSSRRENRRQPEDEHRCRGRRTPTAAVDESSRRFTIIHMAGDS